MNSGVVINTTHLVDHRNINKLLTEAVTHLRKVIKSPLFIIEDPIYPAKKFKIDGVLYQKIESCRLLSAAMLHTIRALEKINIPTCQIEADMVDVRDWDDAKMKSQVSGFIETLL